MTKPYKDRYIKNKIIIVSCSHLIQLYYTKKNKKHEHENRDSGAGGFAY